MLLLYKQCNFGAAEYYSLGTLLFQFIYYLQVAIARTAMSNKQAFKFSKLAWKSAHLGITLALLSLPLKLLLAAETGSHDLAEDLALDYGIDRK